MHSINVKKLLKRPCSTSTLALIFTDHGAAESVSVLLKSIEENINIKCSAAWTLESSEYHRLNPALIICDWNCVEKFQRKNPDLIVKCPLIAGKAVQYLLQNGAQDIYWNGHPICSSVLEGQIFYLACSSCSRGRSLILHSNGNIADAESEDIPFVIDGSTTDNVDFLRLRIRHKKSIWRGREWLRSLEDMTHNSSDGKSQPRNRLHEQALLLEGFVFVFAFMNKRIRDKLTVKCTDLGCDVDFANRRNCFVFMSDDVEITFLEHRKLSDFNSTLVSTRWILDVLDGNDLIDVNGYILQPLPTFPRDIATIPSGFVTAFVSEKVSEADIIRKKLLWFSVELVTSIDEADILIVEEMVMEKVIPKMRTSLCLESIMDDNPTLGNHDCNVFWHKPFVADAETLCLAGLRIYINIEDTWPSKYLNRVVKRLGGHLITGINLVDADYDIVVMQKKMVPNEKAYTPDSFLKLCSARSFEKCRQASYIVSDVDILRSDETSKLLDIEDVSSQFSKISDTTKSRCWSVEQVMITRFKAYALRMLQGFGFLHVPCRQEAFLGIQQNEDISFPVPSLMHKGIFLTENIGNALVAGNYLSLHKTDGISFALRICEIVQEKLYMNVGIAQSFICRKSMEEYTVILKINAEDFNLLCVKIVESYRSRKCCYETRFWIPSSVLKVLSQIALHSRLSFPNLVWIGEKSLFTSETISTWLLPTLNIDWLSKQNVSILVTPVGNSSNWKLTRRIDGYTVQFGLQSIPDIIIHHLNESDKKLTIVGQKVSAVCSVCTNKSKFKEKDLLELVGFEERYCVECNRNLRCGAFVQLGSCSNDCQGSLSERLRSQTIVDEDEEIYIQDIIFELLKIRFQSTLYKQNYNSMNKKALNDIKCSLFDAPFYYRAHKLVYDNDTDQLKVYLMGNEYFVCKGLNCWTAFRTMKSYCKQHEILSQQEKYGY